MHRARRHRRPARTASPHRHAAICAECLALCAEIIAERLA
jgi:hypothetical protein